MCYLRPSLRNGFGSIAHEVLEVGAAVVGMNKLKDILPTDFVVQLYSSWLWIRKRSPAPEIPEYDGRLQVIGDSLRNYLRSQLRPVVDTRSGD